MRDILHHNRKELAMSVAITHIDVVRIPASLSIGLQPMLQGFDVEFMIGVFCNLELKEHETIFSRDISPEKDCHEVVLKAWERMWDACPQTDRHIIDQYRSLTYVIGSAVNVMYIVYTVDGKKFTARPTGDLMTAGCKELEAIEAVLVQLL
jgi:hypothetical protein